MNLAAEGTGLKVVVHAVVAMVFAGTLQAQNLLTNPGFEELGGEGWTFANFALSTGGVNAHSGNGYAYLGFSETAVDSSFSQSVSTLVGQSYLISFWVRDNGTASFGEMRVSFGDTIGVSQSFTGVPHTQISFMAVANGTLTTLTFAEVGTGVGSLAIDDISVSAIPEPSAFGGLAGSLGLAGAIGCRRRRVRRV